jgi:hypothetical protein
MHHGDIIDVDAELVGDDLRERGFLPLPCGDTPVSTVTFPVGSTRTVALSQPPVEIADEGPTPQIST